MLTNISGAYGLLALWRTVRPSVSAEKNLSANAESNADRYLHEDIKLPLLSPWAIVDLKHGHTYFVINTFSPTGSTFTWHLEKKLSIRPKAIFKINVNTLV